MLLNKPSKPPARDRRPSSGMDDRWLLADLEAAQRRNLYAAGHGDGRERTSRRRWNIRRAKHS
jgi:hypothetical protein